MPKKYITLICDVISQICDVISQICDVISQICDLIHLSYCLLAKEAFIGNTLICATLFLSYNQLKNIKYKFPQAWMNSCRIKKNFTTGQASGDRDAGPAYQPVQAKPARVLDMSKPTAQINIYFKRITLHSIFKLIWWKSINFIPKLLTKFLIRFKWCILCFI